VQILGGWVYDHFDGAGHYDLRTRSRELFTENTSAAFVQGGVWRPDMRARAYIPQNRQLCFVSHEYGGRVLAPAHRSLVVQKTH
jgi:hypothetical protein